MRHGCYDAHYIANAEHQPETGNSSEGTIYESNLFPVPSRVFKLNNPLPYCAVNSKMALVSAPRGDAVMPSFMR